MGGGTAATAGGPMEVVLITPEVVLIPPEVVLILPEVVLIPPETRAEYLGWVA